MPSKRKFLPPGPKPWPILENILHVGKKTRESLAHFSKIHGPLVSLRLGAQVLVVGSSPKAAAEILKTHDRVLSARYIRKGSSVENHVLHRIAFAWATEFTCNWKPLRTLCRTELFSGKAIESQAALREKKVWKMVEFFVAREGQVVNVGEVVFDTIFNTISNLLFSKDLTSLEEKVTSSGLKKLYAQDNVFDSDSKYCRFLSYIGRVGSSRSKMEGTLLHGRLTSKKEERALSMMVQEEISWMFFLQMDLTRIKSIG